MALRAIAARAIAGQSVHAPRFGRRSRISPTTTRAARALRRRRPPRSPASAASRIPPACWAFRRRRPTGCGPGLLLYGVSPFAGSIGADYGLKPVMTLRSHVIAVKDLAPGERVGYGGDWTADTPDAAGGGGGRLWRRVSAQPGLRLSRAGQRRARAPRRPRVDGHDRHRRHRSAQRAPQLGDPVILWGEGLPVEEIAVWADTIPYELLCGISQRVAVTLSSHQPSVGE